VQQSLLRSAIDGAALARLPLKFKVDNSMVVVYKQDMKSVSINEFGKDHWSLLAFIETLCVDFKGLVSDMHRRNFRVNLTRHPGYGYFPMGTDGHQWKSTYGSRLKGFFDKKDPKLQLKSHDDWDCAEDFERAGLLENRGTGMNPVFKLTPLGQAVAAELRKHKQDGGKFADFNPTAAGKKVLAV
jgi:hypothetical protein